jgi:hypothetical protein
MRGDIICENKAFYSNYRIIDGFIWIFLILRIRGAVLAPNFYTKRASTPGRPLNSAPWALGFLAILPSLAASLRQPCKNGKNHSPMAPHFRSRPCPFRRGLPSSKNRLPNQNIF